MNRFESRVESFFESVDRKPFWFLLFLVAVNSALKFFQLSDESIWLDEAHTATQALKSIHEIISDSAKDQNPPLYFILVHFWVKFFGISEMGIRSFSAVLSLITAVVLFLFAKKEFNVLTAVIAALLFTFSTQQIYFALEARTYALTGLLCILSFMVFFRLIKKPSIRNILALGILNALLMYTHFISAFIIVVQLAYVVLAFLKTHRQVILYELSAIAISILIFTPWISNVISNVPREGIYWLAPPTFYNLKGLFISFSNGKMMTVLFGILITWSSIVALKRYYTFKQLNDNQRKLILLLFWFLVPVITDYLLSRVSPIFLNKYLLYTSTGLYLLTGFSISELPFSKQTRYSIALIVLVLFAVNAKTKVEKPEGWRAASDYVKAVKDKDDVVILSSSPTYMPFSYYYDSEIFTSYQKSIRLLSEKRIFVVDDLDEEKLKMFNPSKRIILVESHPYKPGSDTSPLKIVQTDFVKTQKKIFGDVSVFVCSR